MDQLELAPNGPLPLMEEELDSPPTEIFSNLSPGEPLQALDSHYKHSRMKNTKDGDAQFDRNVNMIFFQLYKQTSGPRSEFPDDFDFRKYGFDCSLPPLNWDVTSVKGLWGSFKTRSLYSLFLGKNIVDFSKLHHIEFTLTRKTLLELREFSANPEEGWHNQTRMDVTAEILTKATAVKSIILSQELVIEEKDSGVMEWVQLNEKDEFIPLSVSGRPLWPALETVELYKVSFLKYSFINDLNRNSPALRRLRIDGCIFVSPRSDPVDEEDCRPRKRVKGCSGEPMPPLLELLQPSESSIRELELIRVRRGMSPKEQVRFAGQLRQLESFTFDVYHESDNYQPHSRTLLSNEATQYGWFGNLQSLHVKCAPMVDVIIGAANNLKKLTLENQTLDSTIIQAILNRAGTLVYIDLWDCRIAPNEVNTYQGFLTAIMRGCTMLRVLRCDGGEDSPFLLISRKYLHDNFGGNQESDEMDIVNIHDNDGGWQCSQLEELTITPKLLTTSNVSHRPQDSELFYL
ncbi:hypothetical protein BGW38_007043, partial [Lunasporangiospora selenospora]